METFKQHIHSYLNQVLKKRTQYFERIFYNIESDLKIKNLEFIRYLDHLINDINTFNRNSISALHIHIAEDLSETQRLLIAEYLGIKSFNYYLYTENKEHKTTQLLNDIVASIESDLNKLELTCPEGASAKNGGNKIWKNWVNEKNDQRTLLFFYKNLPGNPSFQTRSIINTQTTICTLLSKLFELRPYCAHINSSNRTFNLINSTKTLNEIDALDSDIIDELDSIIMFDCEKKSLMSSYSYDQVYKWNTDYQTKITKYIIVTFGKEYQSINKLQTKIDQIKDKLKVPVNTSYIISKYEIDMLFNRKKKSFISVKFPGCESSIFWETFLIETSIRELYELRSIKLMNIYSICYTEDIKSYIIENIFSTHDLSEIISSTTKMILNELRDDDLQKIKEALSNTLDLIIQSDIMSRVIKCSTNGTTIILDEAIIKNAKLLSKINNIFPIGVKMQYKKWSGLLKSESDRFLVLSFRDQGKFPNYNYPNLLEFDFDSSKEINALFPSFLFRRYFDWSKYQLLKQYHSILSHPFREKYFEWNILKQKINKIRPLQTIDVDWNLENEYSGSEQKEVFKIKLRNQKIKTYYSSDLFIYSDAKLLKKKVVKLDFVMNHEIEDSSIFLQSLDEIQENINIYDRIIDKKQQEADLDVIKRQFDLGDETAGSLWKVLLKKHATLIGENNLYIQLQQYFDARGLKLVSYNHFKNSWINTQSESIAPLSKSVFLELCEYLKIPKTYFIIMQSIRNSTKQSSSKSTRQMNQLLKDLFNDGCFDAENNVSNIIINNISKYKSDHPLDELGINEKFIANTLITLVELIQPEINLVELELIQKITNE